MILEEDLRVKLCGRYHTQVPFEQCCEVPLPQPQRAPIPHPNPEGTAICLRV